MAEKLSEVVLGVRSRADLGLCCYGFLNEGLALGEVVCHAGG